MTSDTQWYQSYDLEVPGAERQDLVVVVPGTDRLERVYRDLQAMQTDLPVDIGPVLDQLDQLKLSLETE